MINNDIDSLIDESAGLAVALGAIGLITLYRLYRQLKAKRKLAKTAEEKAQLDKEIKNTELKIQKAKEKEKK